jgi:hypothetical protein
VLLRPLQFAQVVVEAIEALLPVPTVLADPVGHVAQPFRLEAARSPLSLAPLLDEPGALENLEVFRDRRKAQVKWGCQLRDRRLPVGQSCQDGPASGIGQGRECGAEWIRLRLQFSCRLINLLE